MIRKEMASKLAKKLNVNFTDVRFTVSDADKIIDSIEEFVFESLKNKEEINICGVNLTVEYVDEKNVRDPRDQSLKTKPAHYKVKVKAKYKLRNFFK